MESPLAITVYDFNGKSALEIRNDPKVVEVMELLKYTLVRVTDPKRADTSIHKLRYEAAIAALLSPYGIPSECDALSGPIARPFDT